MSDDRTHIHRDITPGEIFRHKGCVTVHGHVGADARIDISGGNIVVTGDVGDNAIIRTRGTGDLIDGIVIRGSTSNHVTLDSNLLVRLEDAGDYLRVRCGATTTFAHAGDGLNINARGDVLGGNIGRNAHICSKGYCAVGQLGHGSLMVSGTFMQLTKAGHNCRILSGETVNMAALGANSAVFAAKDALIGISHVFAGITAGRTFIRETSSREEDFTLLDDKKWKAASFRP